MRSNKGKWLLSSLLVLALLLSAVPAFSASAVTTTEILLDPTPVEVVSGDPFTVTLKINDIPAPGVYIYLFTITYNSSVIQFGELVGDHDWSDPIFGAPTAFAVDNSAGSISFTDFELFTPASGNVTLVTLHGTATATESASTALQFDTVDIMDFNGNDIPATVTDGEVVVWVAPVASFTWGYTDSNGSGTLDAGEQIQFTDTSTNSPASWYWDFDDGDTSTSQNPTHSYSTATTFNVCLDAANPADSDQACEDIPVEPACLDNVNIFPDPGTVMINSVTDFDAVGYDEFSNTIPGISWSWLTTNPTGGTIISATGSFTAGSTPGTYPDLIEVSGSYKNCARTAYITVEVVSLLADIGMSKSLGGDDVVLVDATILKIYNPSAPATPVPVPGGIAGYVAEASYNGSRINILGVRGGDYPFDDPLISVVIDDVTGNATFGSIQTKSGDQAPITVAGMVVRLVGCTDEEAQLELSFNEISDGDGNLIPQDEPDYEVFRRGNAKSDDDVVNIADALFIAQYLVSLRDLGQGTGLVHPVNAASIKHDDGGDKVSIADVLFIAQSLVGIRDNCFEMVP